MDEAQIEREAERVRNLMLRLWDGDAERSDAFMCFLIRYYKDNSGDVSPEDRDHVLKLMMKLLQR